MLIFFVFIKSCAVPIHLGLLLYSFLCPAKAPSFLLSLLSILNFLSFSLFLFLQSKLPMKLCIFSRTVQTLCWQEERQMFWSNIYILNEFLFPNHQQSLGWPEKRKFFWPIQVMASIVAIYMVGQNSCLPDQRWVCDLAVVNKWSMSMYIDTFMIRAVISDREYRVIIGRSPKLC